MQENHENMPSQGPGAHQDMFQHSNVHAGIKKKKKLEPLNVL